MSITFPGDLPAVMRNASPTLNASHYEVLEAGGISARRAVVFGADRTTVLGPDTLVEKRVSYPSGSNDFGKVGVALEDGADGDFISVAFEGLVDAAFKKDLLPQPGEAVVVRDSDGILQPMSGLTGDEEANIIGYVPASAEVPPTDVAGDEVTVSVLLGPANHRPLVFETFSDTDATAKVGGTTVFKSTGAGTFTLTIPDGVFDGQSHTVLSDAGGGGTLQVQVTNHVLGAPITFILQSGGGTLELLWSEDLGQWTSHVPAITTNAQPSGSNARFLTVLDAPGGGSKFVPVGMLISESAAALLLQSLDFSVDGDIILNNISSTISAVDGTVEVDDELQVNEEVQINGAPKTGTLSGVTLTPAIFARASDTLRTVLIGEYSSDTANDRPLLCLRRSRGGFGAEAIVAASDQVGSVHFAAYDGVDDEPIASILATVAPGTTPAANDVAGQLDLQVREAGGAIPVTALTLEHTGRTVAQKVFENRAGRVVNLVRLGVNTTLNVDTHHMVVVTASGVTISLPASPEDGEQYIIKRLHGGAPSTLDGNGNDVGGAASQNLNADRITLTVVFDATAGEWLLI